MRPLPLHSGAQPYVYAPQPYYGYNQFATQQLPTPYAYWTFPIVTSTQYLVGPHTHTKPS